MNTPVNISPKHNFFRIYVVIRLIFPTVQYNGIYQVGDFISTPHISKSVEIHTIKNNGLDSLILNFLINNTDFVNEPHTTLLTIDGLGIIINSECRLNNITNELLHIFF